jgi:hypothetical protein
MRKRWKTMRINVERKEEEDDEEDERKMEKMAGAY